MDRSDYETASEYNIDFDSDKEPPVDKLKEKKMIHKSDRLRVYKRILRLGKRNLDMPAKFDRVDLRLAKLDDEVEVLQELDQASLELRAVQLGITDFGEDTKAMDKAVSSMKKDEIAFFEIEEVYLDLKTKDRKKGQVTFMAIELKSWMTIIDVFGDGRFMKIVAEKGTSLNRIEESDEIDCELALFNGIGQCVWSYSKEGFESFKMIAEEASKVFEKYFKGFDLDEFGKIVNTLKNKDTVFIEMNDVKAADTGDNASELAHYSIPYIRQDRKELFISDTTYGLKPESWYFEIKIRDIRYFDDIFQDGSVVKYVTNSGCSTAKVEDLSKVYFDYKILIKGTEIHSSKLTSLQGRTRALRESQSRFLRIEQHQRRLPKGI